MVNDRENTFVNLLKQYTETESTLKHSKPKIDDIRKAGIYDAVTEVYKKLGGILDLFPCNVGKYDLSFDNHIVELDEEAHFNRYRIVTLDSSIYAQNKFFSAETYKLYCKDHEDFAIRHRSGGGFWTNSSTEKQFGKASKSRDFSRNGSPRWKQRAFYDFLKDLVPTLYDIPLIRISIYDEFESNDGIRISVNDILNNADEERFNLIYDEMNKRLC
ncbi:MAG: hypothetical protein DRP47_02070 [Candidatus Zixiibacteriota bacterium]|nr:MAG: hypothetical protein DRP47_02070 [candidate division Zixibacteria bacterium]